MTHIEFLPYHNYHINFKVTDGRELSGVVIDSLEPNKVIVQSTLYNFIPSINMIEWKQVLENGDLEGLEALQSPMDINEIVWAKRIWFT